MENSSLEKSIGKIETEVGKHTVTLDKQSKDISVLKEDVTVLKSDVADLKKQTSRIGIEIVKHTEAIERLVTRSEFNNKINNVISNQDKMMGILERLD